MDMVRRLREDCCPVDVRHATEDGSMPVRSLFALFFLFGIFNVPVSQAQSDAVSKLVAQQIAEACNSKGGKIDPRSVIERDVTGDGKADLIIAHEGIVCDGGGRSGFCGMQVCSFNVYVRKGDALILAKEMLGLQVRVGDGSTPLIQWYAHGGAPQKFRWNGKTFR